MVRLLVTAAIGAVFVCACPNPASLAAQDDWGILAGTIRVAGEVPVPAELTLDGNDRAWCVQTGETFVDRSLIVGEGGGLQNAYVMMYFARGDDRRPAIHPALAEAAANPVPLDNVNCQFQPQAIFVRTGQVLEFRNSDTIGHNCHIITMGNEENISLGAGQVAKVEMAQADRVPGLVKCDIHPWMEAVILVRDEPYAAITDNTGAFRIENIPAGEWTFQFWHQRSGFLRNLEQDGKSVAGRRGEVTVTITAGETLDMGELTVAVDDLLEK